MISLVSLPLGVPCRCPSQAVIVWCRGQSPDTVAHRLPFQQNVTEVVVGGASSQPFQVVAGVPQGSIVGPTLFLVYINDAADVVPDSVYPATYSDDTTNFFTLSSAESSATECEKFQMGVNNPAPWGATWKIQFEPSKSQAMVISRHRNHCSIPTADGQLQWPHCRLFGALYSRSKLLVPMYFAISSCP